MALNFPESASAGQYFTASNDAVYQYDGTSWNLDSSGTISGLEYKFIQPTQTGSFFNSASFENNLVTFYKADGDNMQILLSTFVEEQDYISGSSEIENLGFIKKEITGSISVLGDNVDFASSAVTASVVSSSNGYTGSLYGGVHIPAFSFLEMTPIAPLSTVDTGSIIPGTFAVSASNPLKPYFWDGSNWNALY